MGPLHEGTLPSPSWLAAEHEYYSGPAECLRPDVLVVGSAVGMASLHYLLSQMSARGLDLSAVLAEAGPMDFLSYAAHSRVSRGRFVRRPGRLGGNLVLGDRKEDSMDATRARRTRDRHRRAWYASERRRRFARFLGFPPIAAPGDDSSSPRHRPEKEVNPVPIRPSIGA